MRHPGVGMPTIQGTIIVAAAEPAAFRASTV